MMSKSDMKPPPVSGDVRWAWSAPSSIADVKRRGVGPATAQPVVDQDMLDVVRLLSTASQQIQTTEPSFTQSLNHTRSADEQTRTIALQVGVPLSAAHASTQVYETDVADVPEVNDDVDAFDEDGVPLEQYTVDALRTRLGGTKSSHSFHRPHTDLLEGEYPTFIADAKSIGVCNRYGFLSRPKPPMELPPRRRVKTINPVEYPHLYGVHELQIDETTLERLMRAHNLWVASSGFVPKF